MKLDQYKISDSKLQDKVLRGWNLAEKSLQNVQPASRGSVHVAIKLQTSQERGTNSDMLQLRRSDGPLSALANAAECSAAILQYE